jgi:signal peptidase II
MARRFKVFTIVAALVVVFDQVTKLWARAKLPHDHSAISFIGGFWDWRLSYNLGSAFGLFSKTGGARIFLTVVGIGACAFIVHVLRKAEDWQKWFTTALGLVAGGAVGNVIDRVWDGKVTDFIVWKVKTHEWPAFNIADAALVAGVVIMFLDLGREQKKLRERKLLAQEKEREEKQAEKKRKKK